MSWYLFHSWSLCSLDIRFWVHGCFLSALEKCWAPQLFLVTNKYTVIWCFPLQIRCNFFLTAFSIFFFFFSFHKFDHDVSWCGLLWVILFGFHWVSWIWGITSFTKLGKYSAIYLSIFSAVFFLISFLNSRDMNAWSFLIKSQVPVPLFIFFSVYVVCYSN